MKLILILIFASIAPQVVASRKGNGGDAVVCNDLEYSGHYPLEIAPVPSGLAYYNLDFLVYGFNREDLRQFPDAYTALNTIAAELVQKVPEIGKRFNQFLNDRAMEWFGPDYGNWTPKERLEQIHDENLNGASFQLLPECSSDVPSEIRGITQTVRRLESIDGNSYEHVKSYEYNSNVFNSGIREGHYVLGLVENRDQRAHITLHEFWWDYFKSAADIRKVNSFIFSKRFPESSPEELLAIINAAPKRTALLGPYNYEETTLPGPVVYQDWSEPSTKIEENQAGTGSGDDLGGFRF